MANHIVRNPKEFVSVFKQAEQDALGKFHTIMKDATAECFAEVIRNSPIKTGRFISAWEFFVTASSAGGTSLTNGEHVSFVNLTQNTPTAWSKAKAQELALQFKGSIRALLDSSNFTDNYYLVNNMDNNLDTGSYPKAPRPYAGKIEFGWYTGRQYETEIKPWYTDRPVPYTLADGRWSYKVSQPNGVLRTAFLQAPTIVQRVIGGTV